MDPTPNEAEMREAEEWYRAEWPRRNKDADNWRTVDVIISAEEHRDDCCAAYAAALAKCRVERERLVAALEKYGKHSRECREDQAASGMLGLDVKCLCGLAAAIRGGGQ